MYVIWRSGLQPGRLLHITHILFRCAAMDGGTPACGFSFRKDCFYEQKKAPGVAFFDGRLFLRGKPFVREPAAATLKFFDKKLQGLRKIVLFNKIYYTFF